MDSAVLSMTKRSRPTKPGRDTYRMLDKVGVAAVPFAACCATSMRVAPMPFPTLSRSSHGRPLLAVHCSERSAPGTVLNGWNVQSAARTEVACKPSRKASTPDPKRIRDTPDFRLGVEVYCG